MRQRDTLLQASLALLAWVAFGTPFLQAQGRIQGVVTNAVTGGPVAGAEIVVIGSEIVATTDDEGQYTIEGVPPGLVRLRAQIVGYVPITTPYNTIKPDTTTTIHFRLAPLLVELDTLEVTGESPAEPWHFGGRVLTKEQLPARGDLLTAISSIVAGMRTTGRRHEQQISARGSFRQMLFVVDGTVIEPPLQFYIDAADVQCVEVRRGYRAAMEFRRTILEEAYSGVILIWTKGSTGRKPPECFG